MSGSLWSVVVTHEHRRQDDSHQLSTMQNFRKATDEQVVASVVDGAPTVMSESITHDTMMRLNTNLYKNGGMRESVIQRQQNV